MSETSVSAEESGPPLGLVLFTSRVLHWGVVD